MAASGNSEDKSVPIPFNLFITEPNEGANDEFDLEANPPKFEEFYIRAAQRGLNDTEFSAILKYISSSVLSLKDKNRLIEYAVPISVAPEEPLKDFLFWFFPKYKTIEQTLGVNIFKWIIDLLDNQLASSDVVNIFYFDLFLVLEYRDFYKYACILLCKLTKPQDVTRSKVKAVTNAYESINDSRSRRFVRAVLHVFQGFKPDLVPNALVKVDIEQTFSTMRSGNYLMTLGYRRRAQQNPGDFPLDGKVHKNKINPVSKLIPFPTFKIDEENVTDAIRIRFPESIEEAFDLIERSPIVNILSYLRDETGFFMLVTEGSDNIVRFSMILFQKLQAVFIFQDIECTEEDKEVFLNRVYEIQVFMQQGIASVSQFLMGYLIKWDGIDHRSQILNLIEWVVFDEFKWLSTNILRPFYMLFVTSNAAMKHQIVRCFTNLLKNMFAAIKEREFSHPLKKKPAWINDRVGVLSSLIKWVEEMIRIGLCLEEDDCLLLQSVYFYETVNMLESKCNLPLWTIVSKGVAFRSAFNHTPVILNRVCRLILSYHTDFLPNLRATQPDFYTDCKEKMCTTLKCAKELIAMWTGQEFSSGPENERIVSKKAIRSNLEQSLGPSTSQVNVDTLFDLSHNANWLPYVLKARGQGGPDFLKNNENYLINIEHYLEHIAAFIKYFSP